MQQNSHYDCNVQQSGGENIPHLVFVGSGSSSQPVSLGS